VQLISEESVQIIFEDYNMARASGTGMSIADKGGYLACIATQGEVIACAAKGFMIG
jgi:hypothetical protein